MFTLQHTCPFPLGTARGDAVLSCESCSIFFVGELSVPSPSGPGPSSPGMTPFVRDCEGSGLASEGACWGGGTVDGSDTCCPISISLLLSGDPL